jgi:RNA polymerase sigma-70 factor (ECF subfamily)
MSSLDAVYAAAAGQFSGLAVPTQRFHAAWRRLCDSGESPSPAHAGDLYLALACLDGDAAGLTALEQRLRGQLRQLTRFHLSDDEARTLVSETLASLCTGAHPRLSRYSARGPLDAWLGVLLTRQALSLRTARAPEDLDEVVLGSQASEGVPEVELLKQRFRGVFSDAFKSAIGALDVKQRNLLRQHYLDGLTLEELALLYRVHRATVARNLAEARTTLLERTRDEVAQRTAIGRLEVDSIVRLVQSHLDVSAAFFLNRTGAGQ